MEQNLVGKILGNIKIFVQDSVTIKLLLVRYFPVLQTKHQIGSLVGRELGGGVKKLEGGSFGNSSGRGECTEPDQPTDVS